MKPKPQLRMTHQVMQILRVLLDNLGRETHGVAITKATGIPSGVVYPVLKRFEKVGWIQARWEDVDERDHMRPLRRYVWLTPTAVEDIKARLERSDLAAARRRGQST